MKRRSPVAAAGLLLALAALVVVAERARRSAWREPRAPAAATPGADRTRRLPGARRQLRGLPHARAAARPTPAGAPSPRRSARSTARNLTPDASHRHGRLERRRLLARAAPRPLARRPAALPGVSVHQLHAASRATTPTRSTPTCAACRRWRSRTGRTRCAFPTTRRRRWRSGARCTSSPAASSPTPAQTAEWNRGAYLVQGLGHCSACHAARNALGATRRRAGLAGGLIPLQNWYAPSLAAPRGRRGRLAPSDMVALLQTGVSPARPRARADGRGGAAQHPAPERRPTCGDGASTCKSLPRPRAAAERADAAAPPAQLRARRQLYETHCARCHGARRPRARPGAYPPLAGNRARAAWTRRPTWCRWCWAAAFAPATAGNPRPFGMPPFATELSDEDVAAVLSYIRNAWGNRAGGGAAAGRAALAQQRAALTG